MLKLFIYFYLLIIVSNAQIKFKGFVYDEEFFIPISNATIKISIGKEFTEGKTDSSGYYEIVVNYTSIKNILSKTENIFQQNFPHPFSYSTTFKYCGEGDLLVYDVKGELILKEKLDKQNLVSNKYLAAGIYFFVFNTTSENYVRKIVLLEGGNKVLKFIPITKNYTTLGKKTIDEIRYELTSNSYYSADTTISYENKAVYEKNFYLKFDESKCGNEIGNGDIIISGPDTAFGSDFDQVFRSLTIHPENEDIVYIGTERNGIVKSIDGGKTWTRLRAGLRHASTYSDGVYCEVWDLAISTSNPEILFAATLDSPGPVTGDWPSNIGGVYKSIDEGNFWLRKNCGLENSRITSVNINSVNANNIVIGVEAGEASFSGIAQKYFTGGLFYSLDGGREWNKSFVNDTNDVHNGYWNIKQYDNGHKFISFGTAVRRNGVTDSLENVGFIRTTDGGKTWSKFAEELKTKHITSFDVSLDGMKIFAQARDIYFTYYSEDGGISWKETNINQGGGVLALKPNNPNVLIYSGYSNLFRTLDNFQSYSKVLETGQNIQDIEFSKSNPEVVYVATAGYDIYKSTDGGISFQFLGNLRQEILND